MISLLLLIVQISLTISMGRQLSRNTPVSTMKTMFIIYSLTMGINMTSLAYCYSAGQIAAAFGISAIYFACLAIIGKTTKMDLSKVGNICLIGLVAMIFSQLFFMLFRVSMDVRLWSVIGLLLFTGLTAWDIQKMNYMLNGYEDEKISIYMALQLYLDFLNIFLYILQLVGRRDD